MGPPMMRPTLDVSMRRSIDRAPVIPDGAVRAAREHRSDPGPREAGSDSFREVPDSLAPDQVRGSASGMTGGGASGGDGYAATQPLAVSCCCGWKRRL